MKRAVMIFVMCIIGAVAMNAHRINNYKYLTINSQGNPYDIETKIEKFFTSIGFEIVQSEEFPELSREQGEEALIASYEYNIVYNGHSSIKLTLTNVSDETIFTSKAYGMAFTGKGDMKKALNKIFDQITKLGYQFTPENTASNKNDSWSLDNDSLEVAIKKFVDENGTSPIEGIYNSFNDDGSKYRVGIIKKTDEAIFGGIVIESNMRMFKRGDLIFELTSVGNNQYVGEYKSNSQNTGRRVIASLEGRMLKMVMGETQVFIYAKVYPEANDENDASITRNNVNQKAKYSGSGALISGNVVVTNYHVIKENQKIGVVFNEDEGPKEYNAKILCEDKQNDLALLTINDPKFKPVSNITYEISNTTSSVGTKVFTMGYPLSQYLGNEVKITDGIISPKTGFQGDVSTYQISAPIQPGNSGGPLFDMKGNLIGITNAGVQGANNVGYAIKSTYLLNLIDSAPIEISYPKVAKNLDRDLSSLTKACAPYVVYIKVY